MEQLSFHTSPVLTWLFESTIYISILICLILAIKTVTRKKLPVWWGYGLWLLLILRMLMPWGFESPLNLSIFNYIPAPPKNDIYMPFLIEHKLSIPFPGTADTRTSTEFTATDNSAIKDRYDNKKTVKSYLNLSLDKASLIIWISGIIFFGIFTVYKNLKFWTGVRGGRKIKSKEIRALLAKCMSLLTIRREVSIIVTHKVKSPAIFGYFKPRLLLPPGFLDTLEEDQLRCVFLHELGHMKRHDIGISWLVTFLQIIYWFNPLVWLAFHNLRTDQEIACDAYVLSRINQVQPADYADTIVGLLERFIQNRQLPSLAGIIENRSQIDRRITMILNFKKYTKKMTIVSVLLLCIAGLLFLTSSNGLSTEEYTDELGITESIDTDMKYYENNEWNFALDIPENWNTSPPDYNNSPAEVIRFGAYESGNHHGLIIFQNLGIQSDEDTRSDTQKVLADGGFKNFINGEITIRGKKVLTLDFEIPRGDGTWSCRYFYVKKDSTKYILGFGTTDRDEQFPLFNRIAQSFEIFGPPEQIASTSAEMKHYENDKWNFELDIPENWKTMPPVPSNSPNEVIRFMANDKNGYHLMIFFRSSYDPNSSLYDVSYQIQQALGDAGFGNFVTAETTIDSKKVVTLDFDKTSENGAWSLRYYFVTDGTIIYTLGFGTTNKDAMIELFDSVAKTFRMDSTPVSAESKHYKSDKYDFELDIPGTWNNFPPNPNNSPYEAIRFGSQEGGSHLLIVFRNPRNPDQTLKEACDQTQDILANGGFGNFITAETTIGSKDVITLDFDKFIDDGNLWSCRHYFIPDGNLLYVLGFGTTNKDDMIELFDSVAKTFRTDTTPLSGDFKHYKSNDLNFELDIPGTWNNFPPDLKNSPYEVIRFSSQEGGSHLLIVFKNPANRSMTLREVCGETQDILASGGFGNFITAETTIGSKDVITLDFDKSMDDGNLWSCRHYFIPDGDFMYILGFGTTDKDSMIDLYDRVAKTFKTE